MNKRIKKKKNRYLNYFMKRHTCYDLTILYVMYLEQNTGVSLHKKYYHEAFRDNKNIKRIYHSLMLKSNMDYNISHLIDFAVHNEIMEYKSIWRLP